MNGTTLCSGCSTVAQQLRDVFGDLPIELTQDDVDKLLTLEAISTGDFKTAYDELLDAVNTYGAVRVWSD